MRRRSGGSGPGDAPVTYAAVGATRHDDPAHRWRPPPGYRPLERSVRLGSGAARFRSAAEDLMTWGVQRGSGIEVDDVEPGTGEQYVGLDFDADGTPRRREREAEAEEVFDPTGAPWIANGMSAVLSIPVGPATVHAPVRVVWTVADPHRAGFAYGTLPGHPESGEESFLVEHRDDDSVWFVLRAFSRPPSALAALGAPVSRMVQRRYTRRYLRALHPAAAGAR